ncbi:MAG TPA: alpha/beta hydrolase [Acidiferrobacterales bacterium]|jgi:pimeloyl-ACP methyl ester carboxylesterase
MSRFTIGILAPLVGLVAGCAALPATETGRIDQQRIEFAQLGQGSPVVVFENGLGAPMRSWNKVFPEIGKHTTAFAYHRPDYGDSDPASTPRDGAHIVDELRALLRSRGLAPPYVLVGHSLGGLYMQLFARKYPDEVAGLVLVDSTHPTQMEGAGRIENQPWWARMFFHLFVNGELRREFDAVAATGQEVLRLTTVTGKPVWVLNAIDPRRAEAVHHANRKRADFARLYPGGQVQWVKSGHFIQWDKPEVVIDAIRDTLEAQTPSATVEPTDK